MNWRLLLLIFFSTFLFSVLFLLGDRAYIPDLSNLLAVSTFLFAIFVGFFISRQGNRYSAIRSLLGRFDGNSSAIYRYSQHLGAKAHKSIASIIKREYTRFFGTSDWDVYFSNKSTYLTDIHNTLDSLRGKKPSFNAAMMNIVRATGDIQVTRKELLALQKERIPLVQWLLVYILASVIVIILATIDSSGNIWLLLIKGFSATVILITIVMLHKFDHLTFFEKTIGEATSQDVLDIVAGKK